MTRDRNNITKSGMENITCKNDELVELEELKELEELDKIKELDKIEGLIR